LVAAHPSGDLVSLEGQELGSNFNANGQPKFYLNNQDFGVNSGNGATKRTELKNAIDQMNSSTATVGAGIEVTRNGTEVTAKTKVKFLDDAEGKYHLVVYIIEDHVINFQASVGPSADHRFVMRNTLNGSTFGESIAEGSITANTEIERTFTSTLNDQWNPDNMHYAAVIWKEVDGDFVYVNGHQVQETVVSNLKDITNTSVKMDWPRSDAAHELIITSDQEYQDITLQLMDINGQLIETQIIPQINTGVQNISLATDNLPNGTYAVRLSNRDIQVGLLLVK